MKRAQRENELLRRLKAAGDDRDLNSSVFIESSYGMSKMSKKSRKHTRSSPGKFMQGRTICYNSFDEIACESDLSASELTDFHTKI
jgi:hypothetical protein